MGIVQEREQQGNADGLQAGGLDRRRHRRDLLLIQLGDHITLGVDTFADLEPPAARHQHRRRILEQIIQVDDATSGGVPADRESPACQ